MKSVGEVMAIGRSFQEAVQKALEGDRDEGLAPRQRSEGVELQPADPVQGFIDDLRSNNTPAARAYVQEFDAGRISRAETVCQLHDRLSQVDSGKPLA